VTLNEHSSGRVDGGATTSLDALVRSTTHQEKGIDANDGALEARVAGAKASRILALGGALGKDIVAAVGSQRGRDRFERGERNA
jgi:hypothetical protein